MSDDQESEFDRKFAQAESLLPAWFVPRMMGDVWNFALITSTGHAVIINHINNVRQAKDGTIWIDVDLEQQNLWADDLCEKNHLKPFLSPTSRTDASINAAHIIAALDIADT